MLIGGENLSKIARETEKSISTISREIRQYRQNSDKVAYEKITDCCVYRMSCTKKYICQD